MNAPTYADQGFGNAAGEAASRPNGNEANQTVLKVLDRQPEAVAEFRGAPGAGADADVIRLAFIGAPTKRRTKAPNGVTVSSKVREHQLQIRCHRRLLERTRKLAAELMNCAGSLKRNWKNEAGDAVDAIASRRDIPVQDGTQRLLEEAMAQLEHRIEERTRELKAANETLRREADRRRFLEKRLVAMLENEQRQTGQELHDNIGSQLSGIELLCEAMLREGRRAALGRGVRSIARLIRNALDDTRRIAYSMAAIPSCPYGLAVSLKALAKRTRTTTRCRCTVRTYGAPITDPSVALHLYRITQEAVGNAARHGAARRIGIILTSNRAGVRLVVRDDGCGIDGKPADQFGLGIITMKIRANAIGGSLGVGRNRMGGTDVICTVPRCSTPAQTARRE